MRRRIVGEEDSGIYIGDMLDLADDIEYGKGTEGVSSEPPVVTMSGRVVERCHVCQNYHPHVVSFTVVAGHGA
jgi:hypothetical protein